MSYLSFIKVTDADRIEAIQGRCDAARAHVMRAARDADRLHLTECHKALMMAADVLDDARDCADPTNKETP
jgi:hypothetical protein